MTDLQELMALLEKWRAMHEAKPGDLFSQGIGQALAMCADELEAFLRSPAFAEMAAVYEAWKAAPTGTVDSCDFALHARPSWIVIDDREAVPLNEPRRVRLVPIDAAASGGG